jgi:hypothetical protein
MEFIEGGDAGDAGNFSLLLLPLFLTSGVFFPPLLTLLVTSCPYAIDTSWIWPRIFIISMRAGGLNPTFYVIFFYIATDSGLDVFLLFLSDF